MDVQTENNSTQSNKPLFSPTLIVVMGILFSFISGLLLHTLNWKRLGNKERYRNSLLAFIIWNLVIILLNVLMPGSRKPFALFSIVLNLLYARYFYFSQIAEFKRHLSAGGKKRSIWTGLGLSITCIVCFVVIMGVIIFSSLEIQLKKVENLFAKEEYTKAEIILKKLETNPYYEDQPTITLNLAIVYDETNRKEMALDLLEKYIGKYPDDTAAKKLLSEIKADKK
jgi:tetratricopeptide (TPR) repeat protein